MNILNALEDVSGRNKNPEKRLLWAILTRAVHDLFSYEVEHFRSAHYWIFGAKEDTSACISFSYCCEHLNLDPFSFKRALKRVIKNTANNNLADLRAQLRSGTPQ